MVAGGLLGTSPSMAQGGSSFGLTLVGTGVGTVQVRSINLATGQSAFVQQIGLDGVGFTLGSFTSASFADRAYFVSSNNSLYRLAYQDGGPLGGGTFAVSNIAITGAGLPPQVINVAGDGTLYGLRTNSGGGPGNLTVDFIRLNPDTGVATALSSPAFGGSGYNINSYALNRQNSRAYVVSGSNRIFTLDLADGATLASPQLDVTLATMGTLPDGSLVGFTSSSSGTVEFRSINPDTGATTLLGSAALSGFLATSFVTDPFNSRAYVLSSDNRLLTWDATTGQVINSPTISGGAFQSLRLLPTPGAAATLLLGGALTLRRRRD
ncbi:MAG: hypothetical protein MUE97_00545 [Phycisphaerales bacterium]|nr:hypothetical protein [Phycisphaerales bacterium]